MDEIDVLKKIKKTFKMANIVILLILIAIAIISYILFPANNSNFTNISILIIGLIIVIVNFISYLVICLMYKLAYSKIDVQKVDKEYFRDINDLNSPAIVSFLYDNKIEIYRDYTATILELYIKKYIKINDWKKEVKIYKGENNDLKKLKLHEIYVYECLINDVKFDEEKFEKTILTDAENEGVIEKQKYNIIGIIKLIFLLLIYGAILVLSIIKNEPEIMAVMLLILIPIISSGKKILEKFISKYKLTPKGKQELKKIKALKNFIKDYTLIEEKDIEHIQILEEYIPYSLSLGTSLQVEEYIKQNEIYRNLIYKGRENWI